MLLMHCDVSDAPGLWATFADDMTQDYTHNGMSDEDAVATALHELEELLQGAKGESITKYKILLPPKPLVTTSSAATPHEPALPQIIAQELGHDTHRMKEQVSAAIELLNAEQASIFAKLKDFESGLYFVDGPAGTGKSYLFNTLLAEGRSRGVIMVAAAASGIAATVLQGGGTINTKCRIPVRSQLKHS
jgi:hypothetical protein